jgi:hypothetical protein
MYTYTDTYMHTDLTCVIHLHTPTHKLPLSLVVEDTRLHINYTLSHTHLYA